MKVLLILLLLAFFLNGCGEDVEIIEEANNNNNNRECSVDSDCVARGCSGQVCAPVPGEEGGIVTTCEMKPEYECYKISSCGCIEGKCGWAESEEFKQCFEEKKG